MTRLVINRMSHFFIPFCISLYFAFINKMLTFYLKKKKICRLLLWSWCFVISWGEALDKWRNGWIIDLCWCFKKLLELRDCPCGKFNMLTYFEWKMVILHYEKYDWFFFFFNTWTILSWLCSLVVSYTMYMLWMSSFHIMNYWFSALTKY